jgi:hypothetical protein
MCPTPPAFSSHTLPPYKGSASKDSPFLGVGEKKSGMMSIYNSVTNK